MKTNFQFNNFAVWFDLHDTLLYSTKAWIKAFKKITKSNKEEGKKIIQEYLNGGWKREICKKYNYDYEKVKNVYLTYVKPIKQVKKFAEFCKENNIKIFVVTNAKLSRAQEDIKLLNIEFDKVYSRDDGIKPDINYINKILTENNLDKVLMIGNEEERDVFNTSQVKTIIVNTKTSLKMLKSALFSLKN